MNATTGRRMALGWHKGNSGTRTQPVGSKKANAFGIFDMHGNVSEWCADTFDEGFYSNPAASGPDPLCTRAGDERVDRGGSAFHSGGICRSAARSADGGADDTDSDLGFRAAYYPLP